MAFVEFLFFTWRFLEGFGLTFMIVLAGFGWVYIFVLVMLLCLSCLWGC